MPRIKTTGHGGIYRKLTAEPDGADAEIRAALDGPSSSSRAERTPLGMTIPLKQPEPWIAQIERAEDRLIEILVRHGQRELAQRHILARGWRKDALLEAWVPDLPEGPLSGEALYAWDALRAISAFHEARWHIAPDLYPDWPPPVPHMSERLNPSAHVTYRPELMAGACLTLGALLERLAVLPHEPNAARGKRNSETTRAGGSTIHEEHEATHSRWREIRDRSRLKGRALARHIAALTGDDAEAIRSYFHREAKKQAAKVGA